MNYDPNQIPTPPAFQGNGGPMNPGPGFPYGAPMMGETTQNPPSKNNPEEERKEKMRKRLFWLFFGLSMILLALVIWEVIDCFVGY